MNSISSVQERVGRKRFRSGIEFQKDLLELARSIQDRLLNALPSNYPKDRNTNLAEFFRAVAKEFGRLQFSSSDINEDKYHSETRPEYLFQILGDTLFLGEKVINESLSDTEYRDFLIKVRNAYFEGSRKQNIEDSVSSILGIPVEIQELYLKIRQQPSSSYTLKDTHKMFFNIFMDQASSSSTIGLLLEDLKFFIDIIKPAHVIYDTRLIWTDEFKNKDGACKPSYITEDMPYTAYGTSYIYMVTFLASRIYKFSGTDPEETWEEGVIDSIDYNKNIIDLQNKRILVYNDDTELYVRDPGGEDRRVVDTMYSPGDIIKYYAQKDSQETTDVVTDEWNYSGYIDNIDESKKEIYLKDGSIVVYNEDILVYTRDNAGEYRIEIDDLKIDREVILKATKYREKFQFLKEPEEVQDNFFRQFDSNLIKKPIFQEYVKKEKDIPEGTEEGYDVVIKEGIATIQKIESQFYKKEGAKNYKEKNTDRYSLYIDENYETQFSIDNASRLLTRDEAKDIFIGTYGYTGLNDPEIDYSIDIAQTGSLVENGNDAQVQAIEDQTELCDRRASCQLLPFYEDTRKYWTWPDLEIASGFFNTYHPFTLEDLSSDPGEEDIPAWYYLSADPNIYQVPKLPMLNKNGDPITKDEITVYLNGKLIEDAVETVDPWTGVLTLNFIPPFDTVLRIDYYYSKRFPDSQYYFEKIVSDIQPSQINDVIAHLNIINQNGTVKRLAWPFEVTNNDLYGDDRDYQVNKFPILNKKGELAAVTDVVVSVGSIVSKGKATLYQIVQGDDRGTVFKDTSTDLSGVQDGDTLILSVENYLDNTIVYTIESVDPINSTFKVPNILPPLGSSFQYNIVHFNVVDDSVEDIRPLLGHIRINFLPPLDTIIRFDYHFTHQERNYLMLPDAKLGGGYGSSQYTADTFYGSRSNYTLIVDENPDNWNKPIWSFEELLKVGYRYRVSNLSNSSILNSETFLLNDYDKYKNRASFKNRGSVLNEFDIMFSPEYLEDTDKNVVLNDRYLHKNITPNTILNPGVPLFVDTFTDDTHFRNLKTADEIDTYDPDLSDGKDLAGSFNIINPDDSGIIDFNNVCEYEDNKRINLHSDLKKVEHPNDGYDGHLSTIDEGGQSIPFAFAYLDQYYPNRELRVNDYLDYINQVPSEFKTGTLSVLHNSAIVKSKDTNFLALRIGDTFNIKNVPFEEYDSGSGQYITVYKDLEYVLLQIIDFETGRFNEVFKGPGGSYLHEVTRNTTYAVDVYLNEVNRLLLLNGKIGHTYSLPQNVLMHIPGYGDTGLNYTLNFPDPDPDPYPRLPDNPWISNPTVSYYDIPAYNIDGKIYRTNRSKGITGIIKSTQIIDAEGNYCCAFTGIDSGLTGPSGAADLGLTGPVEYANPTTVEPYDTYQIPAGETGIARSYSEAEYRVQWRNWDQDMIIVMLGETGVPGLLIEDPYNLMDDIGDGIKRSFWNVNDEQLEHLYCHGTVLETSEKDRDNIAVADYPQSVIVLTQDEVDAIQAATDPITELPDLHLGDSEYQLNRRIIREILHDNTIKVTEIQQLIPITT